MFFFCILFVYSNFNVYNATLKKKKQHNTTLKHTKVRKSKVQNRNTKTHFDGIFKTPPKNWTFDMRGDKDKEGS